MTFLEDYLVFVDEALNGMIAMVEDLGDDLANRRPDVEGTNTPYAILTHCLGVMEYWAGRVVAGRSIDRDRPSEFLATGAVADLVARARQARTQLAADLVAVDLAAPPRLPPRTSHAKGRSQAGALLHLFEELAQHRGQMEGCRDVLTAGWAVTVAQANADATVGNTRAGSAVPAREELP
ncbi:MAG: DinB family protein [Acidimicrobiales bacterium]